MRLRSSDSQVLPSPNHSARSESVKAVVFHYTEMKTAAEALERLTTKESRVSAHYLIDERGCLYCLVDENRAAWHAGESSWRGETSINRFSIGIELANPGARWGYRNFPNAQMATCMRLAKELVKHYRIDERWLLAHSDIAPRRKRDPGELFDWQLLAKNGLGFYPPAADEPSGTEKPKRGETINLLAAIGYETTDSRASLTAFQRRWRQAKVDGVNDAQTLSLLKAVASRYGEPQTTF